MSCSFSHLKHFSLVTLLFLSITSHAQWEYVGGSDNYFIPDGSQSMAQILEFQPETAEPYVFFKQHEINAEIGPSLVRYNGTAWEEVDMQFDTNGSTTSDLFGFYFRLGTNIPVVAYENYYWNEEAGAMANDFKVAERIGTEWNEIMGVDNVPFDLNYFGSGPMTMVPNPQSTDPVLIGNSDTNSDFGNPTLVTYFNNDTWEFMGGQDFGYPSGTHYDMDYNLTTEQLYVATTGYFGEDGPMELEVFVFNGDWISLGNPGQAPIPLDEWRIRVSPINGDVYVMATELFDNPNNAQTRTLRISKWDGSSWEILGEPEEIYLNSALGYDLEIHPESGVPYVCFQDGNHPSNSGAINIRTWNGTNWINLDEVNSTFSVGDGLDMEFQPGTNYPYVTSSAGHLLRYVPTGIGIDEPKQVTIQVYPNPATELITFSSQVKLAAIFDVHGRKVSEVLRTKTMSISFLGTGVYFLQLTTENGEIVRKQIVKQ